MNLLNNNMPFLDLHGESRDIAVCHVKEFILDNYKLKKREISIIHGIGNGIIKDSIHKELKNNRLVDSYRLNFLNVGETIVTLKTD